MSEDKVPAPEVCTLYMPMSGGGWDAMKVTCLVSSIACLIFKKGWVTCFSPPNWLTHLCARGMETKTCRPFGRVAF